MPERGAAIGARERTTMARRIAMGLALTLALALTAACDASDSEMERWARKFTQPAIEVTAVDLYREFTRDYQAAADLYSGRRLHVTGTVLEVREDLHFEPVMEFDVGKPEWDTGLTAHFAERHRAAVESWAAGDAVALVCYNPLEEFGIFDSDSVTPLRMCQPLE